MTEILDLDKIMKDVASLTIDSLLIPPMEFDTPEKAPKYYRDHLDSILSEFNQCFKIDLQAHIAKHIADV